MLRFALSLEIQSEGGKGAGEGGVFFEKKKEAKYLAVLEKRGHFEGTKGGTVMRGKRKKRWVLSLGRKDVAGRNQ